MIISFYSENFVLQKRVMMDFMERVTFYKILKTFNF